MPKTGHRPRWQAVGASVRGASHVRAELPNQDAYRWLPASGVGPPLIMAVSDGHGSAKSFRSDKGSAFAVDIGAWVLQDLLDGQPDPLNLSAIKRTAVERLPQEITRRWQEAVTEHLQKTPFSESELETLKHKQGHEASQAIEANPYLVYGATLLTVLVAEPFVLYLQLGDGDILAVSETGEVTRPMPEDNRLFANQTTSLCLPEAWRDFRIRFQPVLDAPPALIMLASDGYANSFVDEAAFLQLGVDYWALIREQGLDMVRAHLPAWLEEATQSGSGDDVTVGLLCRTDLLPSPQDLAMLHRVADALVADAAADAAAAVDKDAQAADHGAWAEVQAWEAAAADEPQLWDDSPLSDAPDNCVL